jgi:hypothetical protein
MEGDSIVIKNLYREILSELLIMEAQLSLLTGETIKEEDSDVL